MEDYKYQPYPKWVWSSDGAPLLIESAELDPDAGRKTTRETPDLVAPINEPVAPKRGRKKAD